MSALPTSPTPWRVHLCDETLIVDANGAEVCRIAGDYETEWSRMACDAMLIVEAVNRRCAKTESALEAALSSLAMMAVAVMLVGWWVGTS